MRYQLFSSGRLLAGAEIKESIARIRRITGLSEEQIWKSLLNGKPKKLLGSDDKVKIKKAALNFRKAGLEVRVKVSQASVVQTLPAESKEDNGPGRIAPNKEKGQPEKARIDALPSSTAPARTKKKRRYGRCLLSFFIFLIILVGGAGGYACLVLAASPPAGKSPCCGAGPV